MNQLSKNLRIAGCFGAGLIFSGCWGNEGGDMGGTALLAPIRAFSEILSLLWRGIIGLVGVLLVLVLFVWIWRRKK